MALAHALRQGPQICARHKKQVKKPSLLGAGFSVNPEPTFLPSQGQFLTDRQRGTVFVCYECLKRDRKNKQLRKTRQHSRPEFNLYQALDRAGLSYTPQYKVGKWPFDLALPELRLLVEIDDASTHDTRRGKARDFYKENYASERGWQVIRVASGPGLATRVRRAIDDFKDRNVL